MVEDAAIQHRDAGLTAPWPAAPAAGSPEGGLRVQVCEGTLVRSWNGPAVAYSAVTGNTVLISQAAGQLIDDLRALPAGATIGELWGGLAAHSLGDAASAATAHDEQAAADVTALTALLEGLLQARLICRTPG